MGSRALGAILKTSPPTCRATFTHPAPRQAPLLRAVSPRQAGDGAQFTLCLLTGDTGKATEGLCADHMPWQRKLVLRDGGGAVGCFWGGPASGGGGTGAWCCLPPTAGGGGCFGSGSFCSCKDKPRVTVTGGQRLPEAFWEQDGEALRRHPASRAACCRSPAVPSITWRLSVEKPKCTSVEKAPGGERRFQPRVVPPQGMARAPPRGNSHPAPPRTACKMHSGSFGTKLTHCPSRAAFAILP